MLIFCLLCRFYVFFSFREKEKFFPFFISTQNCSFISSTAENYVHQRCFQRTSLSTFFCYSKLSLLQASKALPEKRFHSLLGNKTTEHGVCCLFGLPLHNSNLSLTGNRTLIPTEHTADYWVKSDRTRKKKNFICHLSVELENFLQLELALTHIHLSSSRPS